MQNLSIVLVGRVAEIAYCARAGWIWPQDVCGHVFRWLYRVIVEEGRTPRLMDRVRQAIRVRHYSRRTEEAYVHWIRRYIVFHRKTHPSEMGAAEMSTFLTWLAVERHVSASTQNQALSALLFLYKDVLSNKICSRRLPARSVRRG